MSSAPRSDNRAAVIYLPGHRTRNGRFASDDRNRDTIAFPVRRFFENAQIEAVKKPPHWRRKGAAARRSVDWNRQAQAYGHRRLLRTSRAGLRMPQRGAGGAAVPDAEARDGPLAAAPDRLNRGARAACVAAALGDVVAVIAVARWAGAPRGEPAGAPRHWPCKPNIFGQTQVTCVPAGNNHSNVPVTTVGHLRGFDKSRFAVPGRLVLDLGPARPLRNRSKHPQFWLKELLNGMAVILV